MLRCFHIITYYFAITSFIWLCVSNRTGMVFVSDGMVQLPVSVYNGTLMVSHLDGDATMPSFVQAKMEAGVPPSTQTVEIS